MIEVAFLPNDAVSPAVKMFPIADDFAHRLVPREGEKRVQMIWHEEEQRDMPAF